MKPIILCVLDGMGLSKKEKGNAFLTARTDNFDYLWERYPHSKLIASGLEVGLPKGQMGNSEVGHLTIGAGRIVNQPLVAINKAIEENTLTDNLELNKIIKHVIENESTFHILGLVSDGGVHSHINHIISIVKIAKEKGVKNILVHAYLDGRDTPYNSSIEYLNELSKYATICDISGRYYSMDRDKRWPRTKLAYDMLVKGIAKVNTSYEDEINNCYSKEIYDEFVEPTILIENSNISENDGVLFANFRPDRGIQMMQAITNPSFNEFETIKFNNLKVATMFPVSDMVKAGICFKSEMVNNPLGEFLSDMGFTQLRIAETEKYAHVTYFFDGGVDKIIEGCERRLIQSPKVATYDMKPEMSSYELTDVLLSELDKGYEFVFVNYANGDMVGHTGKFDAAVKAVEAVDYNLGRLYKKVSDIGGILIVIADHGNCEEMISDDGKILTAHSTNLVPFIITMEGLLVHDGTLADVAPTVLDLFKLGKPKEMKGTSLIDN